MSNVFTMHGPAQFQMEVWVKNDETGQEGKVTVGLGGAFQYPTPEKAEKTLADMEFDGTLEGFRPMSKEEAFTAYMLEKTGERYALPGGPDWAPITQGVDDE